VLCHVFLLVAEGGTAGLSLCISSPSQTRIRARFTDLDVLLSISFLVRRLYIDEIERIISLYSTHQLSHVISQCTQVVLIITSNKLDFIQNQSIRCNLERNLACTQLYGPTFSARTSYENTRASSSTVVLYWSPIETFLAFFCSGMI